MALYESVRDEKGSIIDFRMKVANVKSAEITGFALTELYSHSVRELIAMRKGTSHFFDVCCRVVEQGQPEYLEYYSQHLDKWLAYSIVKFADGYLLNYIDISLVKFQQQANRQQAQLLESILDASRHGIFAYMAVRDEDGQVVDFEIRKVNQSFGRILGMSPGSVEGKRYSTVFPGALDMPIFELNRQVLASGQPAQTELYFKADTFEGWFAVSITPLGENGLVQTFSDITESRRDKLLLESSAVQLQTVIDSTQTGIFLASPVYNPEGKITDFRFKTVNQALASYAFRPVGELAGKLHGECFPVYFRNGVFEKYCQVCLTDQPMRFEQNYLTDRLNVWMDVSAVMVHGDLLVTFHDFTSIKTLQQQQQQLLHDLKLSNQRLSDFAQIASHDLKEPLRKMGTYATLIDRQFGPVLGQMGKDYLERIKTASDRMQGLIRDILAYSQVGTAQPKPRPMSLLPLLAQVWNDLEIAVNQAQAMLDTSQVQPELMLMADPTRFRQLLQNLLSNALKFGHPERPVRIRISHTLETGEDPAADPTADRPDSSPKDRYHRIAVSDNGIGFDPSYADRIFGLFQRLHSRSEYEGNGLGLALCKQIVEQHGGSIRAHSVKGEGATFTIILPLSAVTPQL